MDPLFARVVRFAARWGVEVRLVSRARSPKRGAHVAPASFSWIWWKTRTVEWGEDPTAKNAAPLLHEVAHCLDPREPNRADEIAGPLLAVEQRCGRLLKVPRSDWMRYYGIDDENSPTGYHEEWSDVSTHVRGVLLAKSLAAAVRWGTLTPDGRPTFRRPWEELA